jgi:hypothetical protein
VIGQPVGWNGFNVWAYRYGGGLGKGWTNRPWIHEYQPVTRKRVTGCFFYKNRLY